MVVLSCFVFLLRTRLYLGLKRKVGFPHSMAASKMVGVRDDVERTNTHARAFEVRSSKEV